MRSFPKSRAALEIGVGIILGLLASAMLVVLTPNTGAPVTEARTSASPPQPGSRLAAFGHAFSPARLAPIADWTDRSQDATGPAAPGATRASR